MQQITQILPLPHLIPQTTHPRYHEIKWNPIRLINSPSTNAASFHKIKLKQNQTNGKTRKNKQERKQWTHGIRNRRPPGSNALQPSHHMHDSPLVQHPNANSLSLLLSLYPPGAGAQKREALSALSPTIKQHRQGGSEAKEGQNKRRKKTRETMASSYSLSLSLLRNTKQNKKQKREPPDFGLSLLSPSPLPLFFVLPSPFLCAPLFFL